MTDLERIVALANHGIIRTPEVKSTTKILKEAPVQPGQRGFTPGVQEPEMRLKNQRGFTPGVQEPELEPTTTASQADAGRMMDINNPVSITVLPDVDEVPDQIPASHADAGRMMDINNPQVPDRPITPAPGDTIRGQDNNPNRDDYTQEEWDKIMSHPAFPDFLKKLYNKSGSNYRESVVEFVNQVVTEESDEEQSRNRLQELAGIFKSSVEETIQPGQREFTPINEEPEERSVDFNDFMQWFFSDESDYMAFAQEAIQSITANGFVKYEKIDMFNRAEYVPGNLVAGGDEDGEYNPAELTLRETVDYESKPGEEIAATGPRRPKDKSKKLPYKDWGKTGDPKDDRYRIPKIETVEDSIHEDEQPAEESAQNKEKGNELSLIHI